MKKAEIPQHKRQKELQDFSDERDDLLGKKPKLSAMGSNTPTTPVRRRLTDEWDNL